MEEREVHKKEEFEKDQGKTKVNLDLDLYKDYIQDKTKYYLDVFSKYDAQGGLRSVRWNWPAFFVTPLWLFYRKMYLYGALSILISFLPLGGLAVAMFGGCYGNHLYYKTCKDYLELAKERSQGDEEKMLDLVKEKGGTNPGLVSILLILLTGSILYELSQFSIL